VVAEIGGKELEKFAKRYLSEHFDFYGETVDAFDIADMLKQEPGGEALGYLHNALDDIKDGPVRNVLEHEIIKRRLGI
jgi:hypothetical protein